MQISLNADEEPWIPRIERAVHHLGGTMAYTVDGNSLAVRAWGGVLSAVFDTFRGGSTSETLHLTNAVWALPNRVLRSIVDGYLDGDGHFEAESNRWRLGFTRNYALERDLRILAARLGATITLNLSQSTCQTGTFPSHKGEWRWERSGHHNELDRGEIVEINASRARHFWDISVDDDSHLYALASGVLTHNCKPNCMPESVTDRCTKAHEYVFLLSKSERYYYDVDAVREPQKTIGERHDGRSGYRDGHPSKEGRTANARALHPLGANKRSVWTVATAPYDGAHFAVFPPALIEPCVLAGSRAGDLVLDVFFGSGTTGQVAEKHGRRWIGFDLGYDELAKARTAQRSLLGRMFS
jgi:hypothetical protein